MPVYQYKCKKCPREWEAFHKVSQRKSEKCCGKGAEIVIAPASKPVVCEYFSEAMNVRITGPRQRAEHMKKNNLAFAD